MKTSILIVLAVVLGIITTMMPEARAEEVQSKWVIIMKNQLQLSGAVYDCRNDVLTATISPTDLKDDTYAIGCTEQRYTYLDEKGNAQQTTVENLPEGYKAVFRQLCKTVQRSRVMCNPDYKPPAPITKW